MTSYDKFILPFPSTLSTQLTPQDPNRFILVFPIVSLPLVPSVTEGYKLLVLVQQIQDITYNAISISFYGNNNLVIWKDHI